MRERGGQLRPVVRVSQHVASARGHLHHDRGKVLFPMGQLTKDM